MKEKVTISKEPHAIEHFAAPGDIYHVKDEYIIENSYGMDTLFISPVNPERLFLYWEVTDTLINSKFLTPVNPEFTIKIYNMLLGEKKAKREQEIYTFTDTNYVNKKYIDYPTSLKPIMAKIGIEADGKFIELIRSKTVSIPSFAVLGPAEDLWLQRLNDLPQGALVKKIETASDNMPEKIPDSKIVDVHKEIEILHHFLDIRSKDTNIMSSFVNIVEQLKAAFGDQYKITEILRQFIDVRSQDIKLLRMLLDLIAYLLYLEGTPIDISKYMAKIMEAHMETGSSDNMIDRQVTL